MNKSVEGCCFSRSPVWGGAGAGMPEAGCTPTKEQPDFAVESHAGSAAGSLRLRFPKRVAMQRLAVEGGDLGVNGADTEFRVAGCTNA